MEKVRSRARRALFLQMMIDDDDDDDDKLNIKC